MSTVSPASTSPAPRAAFVILALMVLAALPLTHCGGGGGASPAGPSRIGSGAPAGTTPPAAPALTPVTAQVVAVMGAALQDEYRAAATYQGVVDDFGSVAPFANILRAEQAHAAAIETLYASRGLTVPPPSAGSDTVPRFQTLTAACTAAATLETGNVALYDEALVSDLPADVRTVFSNLRAASLEAHLPAFSRCR